MYKILIGMEMQSFVLEKEGKP